MIASGKPLGGERRVAFVQEEEYGEPEGGLREPAKGLERRAN